MPWSSGVFTRIYGSTGWTDDKNAATKILASRHDTHDQDLSDGINACLKKDGTNSPTATILPGTDNAFAFGSAAKRWIAGFFGYVQVHSTTVPVNGMYLPAANTVGFATNTTQRLTIGSTGGMTINIPTSGTTLSAYSSATGTSKAFYAGVQSATNNPRVEINSNESTATAQIDFTGSVTPTAQILSGGAQRIGISAAGQTTIYEPLNSIYALKNAATFETGSFTGTLTGCTTSPTATFNWTRVGNMVFIDCPTGVLATSNTADCTITGVSAAIGSVARLSGSLISIQNNSTAEAGHFVISGNTILVARQGAIPFTASGVKGLQGNQLFVYSLT